MKTLNEIYDIDLYDGILSTNPLFPQDILKISKTPNMKWYVILQEIIEVYFLPEFKNIDTQTPKNIIDFVNDNLFNINLETLQEQLLTVENNYVIIHYNNTPIQIGEILCDKEYITKWVSEINEINNQLLKLKQFYEKHDLFANFERELKN